MRFSVWALCPLIPLGHPLGGWIGSLTSEHVAEPVPNSGGDDEGGDENGACAWGPGTWSQGQVLEWVGSLGKPFELYVEKFQENAVDGQVLLGLTESELQDDFGIKNKFHLKKVWGALKGFKKQCQAPTGVRANEIEPNEVAQTNFSGHVSKVVFNKLSNAGVHFEQTIQAVGDDVCHMMQDVEREVLRLETTEKLTHFVLHQTSEVPDIGDESASLMSGAKKDLPKIMDAKSSARAAFHGLKSGLTGLTLGIRSFAARIGARLSTDQRTYELELLGEAFSDWKTNAEMILVNLFNTSSALEERAKLRADKMKVGGAAVEVNVRAIADHAKQLQAAREEHAAIVATRPDVALALKARSGELAEKLKETEVQISSLGTEVEKLKKISDQKADVVKQVTQFVVDQNKKKQEWRDWHIRWCWANLWGPEMEKYDSMADRNIAEQSKERSHAEAAQEALQKMLAEYQHRLTALQNERAEMIGVQNTWPATLKSAGIEATEDSIKTHNEALRIAEGSLRDAMVVAGLSNPEDAAKAIMTSHKATILMSQAASKAADVAERVKAHAKRFDNIIKRIEGAKSGKATMEFLKSELQGAHEAFKLIGDGHELRMQIFEDGVAKAEMIRNLLQEEPVAPTAIGA